MGDENYYNILKISYKCSQNDVKKAYYELIRKCHPDKTKNVDDKNVPKINKAYEVLKNPKTRAEYDKLLNLNNKREHKCPHNDLKEQSKSFYESLNRIPQSNVVPSFLFAAKKETTIDHEVLGQQIAKLEMLREQEDIETLPNKLFEKTFNKDEFNKVFDSEIQKTESNEIIKYDDNIMPYTEQQCGRSFADFSNTRIDTLKPKTHNDERINKNIEELLKERDNETEKFRRMNVSDFKKGDIENTPKGDLFANDEFNS